MRLTPVRALTGLVVLIGVVIATGLILIGGDDVSEKGPPPRAERVARPGSKPSVAPSPAIVEPGPGEVDPAVPEDEDEPAGPHAAVYGRVTDVETGAGVPGAEITIRLLAAEWPFFRRPPVRVTDDGSFRIDGLAEARYLLLASAPGYHTPKPSRLSSMLEEGPLAKYVAGIGNDGADVRLDIALRPVVSIQGRVLTPDDRPASGAQVSQHIAGRVLEARLAEIRGASRPSTTAASDGTFALEMPRGEDVRIQAEAEGHAPGVSRMLETRGRTVITDIILRLQNPGALVGRVLHAEGAPVAGARIWALPGGDDDMQDFLAPLLDPDQAVTSDAAGNFRIEGLAPGTYVVRASAKGQQALVRRGVEIPAAGGDMEIVLRFAAGLAIEGVVTDGSGRPVVGAEVDIQSEDVKQLMAALESGVLPSTRMVTNSDGLFRFVGLEPGKYRVEVTKKGLTREAREGVVAGGPPLSIAMVPGLEVAGTVLDPDGQPVSRAWVRVLDRSDSVWTDAKGSFRIEGLQAGTYTITVEPREGSVLGRASVAGVRAGTMDLVIRLKKALTISGVVLDRDGLLVVGATVLAMPWDKDGLRGGARGTRAKTDAAGAFVIKGTDDGKHRILVHCADGMAIVDDVSGGTTNLRIVLTPRPGR